MLAVPGAVQSPGMPARYLQKTHFNVKMTPAPSTPRGFPPCVVGAAPGSAARVRSQAKATCRGFTEKQLESIQHLEISLNRSPSSFCTGFLRRGHRTSLGSALTATRRRRGPGNGAASSEGDTWSNALQEKGEPKARGNSYQEEIQHAKLGTF